MKMSRLNRGILRTLPVALWTVGTCGNLSVIAGAGPQIASGVPNKQWEIAIPATAFTKIESFSAKNNYYSFRTDSAGGRFIHAQFEPPGGPTRFGYKFPDTLTDATSISWEWRVTVPPQGADERLEGKNDSGAGVYLIFKKNLQTLIIKYVFSTKVPQGTVIRRDPLYPFQRMCIVVANTWQEKDKGSWKKVTVNVKEDFKRLFESDACPPLRGIGILSDGDDTKSEVIADYGRFVLSGVKN